jgi:hypothetical protein
MIHPRKVLFLPGSDILIRAEKGLAHL